MNGLLLPVRLKTDSEPEASTKLIHPVGMDCPLSHLRAPRAPNDPCCALRAQVVSAELATFRKDVTAHCMHCNKSPASAQEFSDELYECAAEIERDYAGRLRERLGAHRGGAIDAETGLITEGPRSTVEEAVELIRRAGDWFQEAAQHGFGVEAR